MLKPEMVCLKRKLVGDWLQLGKDEEIGILTLTKADQLRWIDKAAEATVQWCTFRDEQPNSLL